MIDSDGLVSVLERLINDSSEPIIADHYSASRDSSIATGVAGVRLAISEVKGGLKFREVGATSSCSVFDYEVDVDGEDLRLSVSPNSEAVGPLVLGDVFTGYCGYVWSRLVLNKPVARMDYVFGPGSIVRPGLGHGQLIRDLILWLTSGRVPPSQFQVTENALHGLGWCNGLAGKAVALAIADRFSGSGTSARVLEDCIDQLAEMSFDSAVKHDPTLCHGLPGALVVLAGLGRLFGRPDLVSSTVSAFDTLVDESIMLGIPDDVILDRSWLTGLAGVLWAHSAVRKTPVINPLLPTDSIVAGNYAITFSAYQGRQPLEQ